MGAHETSAGARCAVNAILIGADRDLSARVFSGFALPWRVDPVEVHRPDDGEAACAWLRTVVEPSDGHGLRFPCGLVHLWRSDLFQQHVMLLGSCQVSVVVLSVDEPGSNAGRRLLEELRAIRPDGEVLVAAVHEGGVLAPEPADILELLGESGSELRLDVVTVQQGSRLDTHRLAHSLRLAARRSLARSWQSSAALDWSAEPPRPEWFAAMAEPVVASDPKPNSSSVTPALAGTSAEPRRQRSAGGSGGVSTGPAVGRTMVVEDMPPPPDYNPPNVTADMAASIAAAIHSSAGGDDDAAAGWGPPAASGRGIPSAATDGAGGNAAGTRSRVATAGAPRFRGAQRSGLMGSDGKENRAQPSGEQPGAGDEPSAPPRTDTPRKRGLLRTALGI